MLADVPASLQRVIARTQRISLPRGCTADERVLRVRQALCHAATVRATYATPDHETQHAVHWLRRQRGGVDPTVVAHQFGAVRAWHQIAADPQPHTIAKRLVLLGWLVPRMASHATRSAISCRQKCATDCHGPSTLMRSERRLHRHPHRVLPFS